MDATAPNAGVELSPIGPCALATVLWRRQGALQLTVIVKGTFAFSPDAAMTVIDPEDVTRAEVPFDGARSVRHPSDLVPSLPRADVTVVGHACAPTGGPVPLLNVRLVVFRDAPLVDKAIHVRGDTGPTGEIAPFERIPLVYERAYGGPSSEENPFGKGAHAGDPPPNLFDPRNAQRTACFAPIASAAPVRNKLLGGADRRVLDRPIVEIPQGFDWSYFQSAPEDQRTEYLQGTEWVVLERMTTDPTFVRSHLPGARGVVRVSGLAGVPEDHAMPLAADTLRIDADQLRCTVVWRRSFPVASVEEVARVRVQGAVQIGATPIEWPLFAPRRTSIPAPKPPPLASAPQERKASLSGTVDLPPPDELPREPRGGGFTGTMLIEPESPGAAPKAAVPFKPGPAVLPVSKSRPPDDGERVGSGTIGVAVPAPPGPKPPAPRSMPFGRPPTNPPAAPPPNAPSLQIPVVAAPALSAGPGIGAPAMPRLPATPSAPMDEQTADDAAPIARRFDRAAAAAAAEPAPMTAPMRPAFGATPTFGATPPAPMAPTFAPLSPPMAPPMPAPAFAPPAAPTFAAPAASPPAASPKRAPGVSLVNATGLAFEAIPWGLEPSRDCFTVIAKATADLVPGGPAKLRPKADPPSEERWLEAPTGAAVLVYPSDRALYKVRADVVAIANAHAPKGPATKLDARFSFGASGNAFAREITVHGDRRWEKRGALAVASAAEPFLRMALGWERAFGGKGHDANPVGVGVEDRLRRGPTPLPNLEDPSRKLRTPKQIVPPLSLAPMPLSWKRRAPARTSFPEEAVDWTRFQIAPVEQQLALLRGDEPYAFEGMHRAHPSLAGALPGVRARAFADFGDRFEEVTLRLDTVVFTIDELKVDLLFRGALPVPDERAPPSIALHLVTEPVASPPMTVEEARAKLARA